MKIKIKMRMKNKMKMEMKIKMKMKSDFRHLNSEGPIIRQGEDKTK
jgi:hypothetical protein